MPTSQNPSTCRTAAGRTPVNGISLKERVTSSLGQSQVPQFHLFATPESNQCPAGLCQRAHGLPNQCQTLP
jgi:hypothetical protein